MHPEFKLIPKSKQNVILLRLINSTAYSGSNYSACRFHKLPPPSFSALTSFLQPTSQAFYSLPLLWPETAKGAKRGASAQPFLLLDVGKAWWGGGWVIW